MRRISHLDAAKKTECNCKKSARKIKVALTYVKVEVMIDGRVSVG